MTALFATFAVFALIGFATWIIVDALQGRMDRVVSALVAQPVVTSAASWQRRPTLRVTRSVRFAPVLRAAA